MKFALHFEGFRVLGVDLKFRVVINSRIRNSAVLRLGPCGGLGGWSEAFPGHSSGDCWIILRPFDVLFGSVQNSLVWQVCLREQRLPQTKAAAVDQLASLPACLQHTGPNCFFPRPLFSGPLFSWLGSAIPAVPRAVGQIRLPQT